jgi:hypothetical protein
LDPLMEVFGCQGGCRDVKGLLEAILAAFPLLRGGVLGHRPGGNRIARWHRKRRRRGGSTLDLGGNKEGSKAGVPGRKVDVHDLARGDRVGRVGLWIGGWLPQCFNLGLRIVAEKLWVFATVNGDRIVDGSGGVSVDGIQR